ncbi:MAG: carbohydrate-binding domain-containing protein [Coriobacteriaceae bacterium]|nr:carbohydrate-binding domain-containing protein [Coriobacteriaceae bacterium]
MMAQVIRRLDVSAILSSVVSLALTLMLLQGCASSVTGQPGEIGGLPTDNSTVGVDPTNGDSLQIIQGIDFSYSERDQDASYDPASATSIILEQSDSRISGAGARVDGATITIDAEGAYILSGMLTDGAIVVDAGAEAKVQLVLDGVSVTNSNGPALLVEQADKTFVTLADGSSNTFSDTVDRSDLVSTENNDRDNEDATIHDAALFSHDDLTFNGGGTLNVNGLSAHAIVSKDDLIITGGSYMLRAVADTLQGKDCVKILVGSFDLNAGDDAIASTKTEDVTAGFVVIDGGDFTITAQGDAIHAETVLRATGGTVDIRECNEGLEGAWIQFQGGEFHVVSIDDGLNAASDYQTDLSLEISGGYLYVDAEGDGVDSNGTFAQSGGTVIICGPTREGNGALDYTGTATINGGTLLAVGTAGMAQGVGGGDSTQASILYSPASTIRAGTALVLADEQGAVVFSFKTPKDLSSLVFSSAELEVGDSYDIYSGATISENDEDAFSSDGTMSGGTLLTSFTLSQKAVLVSADGSVSEMPQGGMAGMGGGPGGRPGFDGRGQILPEGFGGGSRGAFDGSVPGNREETMIYT